MNQAKKLFVGITSLSVWMSSCSGHVTRASSAHYSNGRIDNLLTVGQIQVNSLTVAQNMAVNGPSAFNGSVDCSGAVTCQGDLLVQGDASLTGNCDMQGNFSVVGQVTMQGPAQIMGDVTALSLNVSGSSVLGNSSSDTCTIQGLTTINAEGGAFTLIGNDGINAGRVSIMGKNQVPDNTPFTPNSFGVEINTVPDSGYTVLGHSGAVVALMGKVGAPSDDIQVGVVINLLPGSGDTLIGSVDPSDTNKTLIVSGLAGTDVADSRLFLYEPEYDTTTTGLLPVAFGGPGAPTFGQVCVSQWQLPQGGYTYNDNLTVNGTVNINTSGSAATKIGNSNNGANQVSINGIDQAPIQPFAGPGNYGVEINVEPDSGSTVIGHIGGLVGIFGASQELGGIGVAINTFPGSGSTVINDPNPGATSQIIMFGGQGGTDVNSSRISILGMENDTTTVGLKPVVINSGGGGICFSEWKLPEGGYTYSDNLIFNGNVTIAGSSLLVSTANVMMPNLSQNTDPSLSPIVVDGTGQVLKGDSITNIVSSRRLKHAIQALKSEDARDLYALEPVSFVYDASPEIQRCGLIAEDVEKMPYLKRAVRYSKNGQVQALEYNTIYAVMLYEFIKLKKAYDILESEYGAYVAKTDEQIEVLTEQMYDIYAQYESVLNELAILRAVIESN